MRSDGNVNGVNFGSDAVCELTPNDSAEQAQYRAR